MQEDADPAAGQVAPDSATIVSCMLLSPFTSGEQEDEPPQEDCAAPVAGTRGDNGVWSFDLTPFAQSWGDGAANNGVSLRFGSRNRSQNWRVVFDAAASRAVLVSDSSGAGGGPLLGGGGPLDTPPPPPSSGDGSDSGAGGSAPVDGGGAVLPPPENNASDPASGGGADALPPLSGESSSGAAPPVGPGEPNPEVAPPGMEQPQAATAVPEAVSSVGPAVDDAVRRLPLVTLVLAPALAAILGFAVRSPLTARLIDPSGAPVVTGVPRGAHHNRSAP